MHGHGRHTIHEENDLGKVYDSRLVKRLFKYAKPYKWLIVLSLLFTLLAAGGQILRPYLLKVGIDRHLVYNHRYLDFGDNDELKEEIKNEYKDELVKFQGENYYINADELEIQHSHKLKEKDIMSDERYYLLAKEELSSEEKQNVNSLVEEHPDWFEESKRFYLGSAANLEKLTSEEIKTLRSNDFQGIIVIALIYLGILILNFGLNYSQVYIMTYVGQRVMYSIRVELFSHIQNQALAFFDKNPIGRLVTRVTNDIKALHRMFTQVVVYLFKDFFLLVGIMTAMLLMNWQLALVCFTVIPLLVAATFIFKKKIRKAYRKVRVKLAKINSKLSEDIQGVRVIKIFAREIKNILDFDKSNVEKYEANMKQLLIRSIYSPVVQIISTLGTALIIWYGGGQVIKNALSLGELVAFLSLMKRFFKPIRDMAQKYNIMQSAMAASERVFQIMDKEETIEQLGVSKPLKEFEGEVEFQNVTFSYDDEEKVLKDVSFKVEPGNTLALVGPTGSGKSTIIKLLTRFYDVDEGKILVDGVDIKKIDKKDLREKFAVVMQEVFLFAGSIKRNIRLNRDNISDEEIYEIAEYVNADKFIEKLPQEYEEELQSDASSLSIGQKQLLSFARALAHEPNVLILDEATANIDTRTEELVQEATKKLMRNNTSIIIAHRLSTIQQADKILVIREGEIVETGDHQELLKKEGIYYNLYKLQKMRSQESSHN